MVRGVPCLWVGVGTRFHPPTSLRRLSRPSRVGASPVVHGPGPGVRSIEDSDWIRTEEGSHVLTNGPASNLCPLGWTNQVRVRTSRRICETQNRRTEETPTASERTEPRAGGPTRDVHAHREILHKQTSSNCLKDSGADN